MIRLKTNDISVQESAMMAIELGERVFSALCAENEHPRFLQGVSDLFYQTDDSGEDWSDVVHLIHIDTMPDFTLEQGIALMMNP